VKQTVQPRQDSASNYYFSVKPLSVVFVLLVMAAVLLISESLEIKLVSVLHADSLASHLLVHFFCDLVALILGGLIIWLPVRRRQLSQRLMAEAVRQSDDRYRTLVESLDVGVALFDADCRPVMINQAMRELGCVEGAGNQGDACYRYLFARDTPCSGCLAEQALTTRSCGQFELKVEDEASAAPRYLKIRTIPTQGESERADGFIEVVEDITRERQAQFEIQELSRRLNEADEQEHKLLAQELHDQCGQVLAAVQFKIEFLKSRLARDNPEMRAEFDQVTTLVAGIGDNIREVASRLRPPILDESGLLATLEWQARLTRNQNPGLEVDLDLDELPMSLPADIENTVYRVVQEALINITRHAGADQVGIELKCDGSRLGLRVVDNGCGFDVDAIMEAGPSEHIGLRGIKERVQSHQGQLLVDSLPGRGTRLTVSLPIF